MQQRSAHLELDGGRCGVLRVEFHLQGDRFLHAVQLVTDDHRLPLLRSCDGPDDARWPQSPPLQELDVEGHGSRATLMLLGRTSTGHWSLCVHQEFDRMAVLFDVACRARCQPARLGSRYLVEWAPQHRAERPGRIRRPAGGEPCGPAWRLTAAAAGAPEARIRRTASHLDVSPRLPADPFPQTVRWTYRIEAVPDQPVPS